MQVVQMPWRAVRTRVAQWPEYVGWPLERSSTGLLALACIALGLWLRARGVVIGRAGFGVDEATWTVKALELPLAEVAERPAGFMALSRAIASLLGPSERVMRLIPWLAGSATVLMAAPLAKRLFASEAARLLFVAVLTLHPCAIDFSREYKPYSASLALHVALLLLALRYSASGRSRDLAWLLGVAAVGNLGAQDLVFAYPGVFLVAGWRAFERRRAHLVPLAAAALGIVGVLALQYFLLWRRLDDPDFWGNKYNVFYEEASQQSYFTWLVGRWLELVEFPGFRDTFWSARLLSHGAVDALRAADRVVWVVLHVVGIAVIALGRRTRDALLLILPLVVFWAFNLARFWPFGAFRSNLFALAYFGALAACALDVPAAARSPVARAAPALILVLAPLFALDPGWHGAKRKLANSELFFAPVLKFFAGRERSPDVQEIVLNYRTSCDPWQYYAKHHPRTAPRYGSRVSDLDVRCVTDDSQIQSEIRAAVATGRPTWFVASTSYAFQKATTVRGTTFTEFGVGTHAVFAIEPAPASGSGESP